MGPFSGWTFCLWMVSSHLVYVWLHAWKDALAVIVLCPFVLSCGCPSFSSLVCLCFSMVLNRPWGGSHGLVMDMVPQRHRMDPERLSSLPPVEKKLPTGTHPWMPLSSDAMNRRNPTGSVGVSACHAKGSQGATAIPGVSAIEGATVHSGVSARGCVCVDPCHPWSAGGSWSCAEPLVRDPTPRSQGRRTTGWIVSNGMGCGDGRGAASSCVVGWWMVLPKHIT